MVIADFVFLYHIYTLYPGAKYAYSHAALAQLVEQLIRNRQACQLVR